MIDNAGDVNQFVGLIQLQDRNTLSQEDVEEGEMLMMMMISENHTMSVTGP